MFMRKPDAWTSRQNFQKKNGKLYMHFFKKNRVHKHFFPLIWIVFHSNLSRQEGAGTHLVVFYPVLCETSSYLVNIYLQLSSILNLQLGALIKTPLNWPFLECSHKAAGGTSLMRKAESCVSWVMGLVFVSSTVRVVLAGLYDSFIQPMAKFLEDGRDVQLARCECTALCLVPK